MMDIREFQKRLMMALLGWATASIALGLGMSRGDDAFRRGVGEQFAGWGLVNALIAVVGGRGLSRRQHRPELNTTAAKTAEKRQLARILWLNTVLDVFYVLGGARYARNQGAADERRRGRGVGIVIQGGFLFFFDLINAIRVEQTGVADNSQR